MSGIPTWPTITGALGSTTTAFGASDWANLISQYFNGTNIALLDASKAPLIGTLTRYVFEKLSLLDTDSSHSVVLSVDDIDTGPTRKIRIRRMNTPYEEDFAVLEQLGQTLINKSINSDNNTITNIKNTDIKSTAGITDTKLAQITDKAKLPSTAVYNDQTNSFGDFNQVFKDNRLLINNPADTFVYTIIGAAIAANRNITLPLLTGNDVMVTEAFTQTLTNKTLVAGSNTITGIVDANIGSHTTTKITTTAKGQLNSAIVYNDQTNSLGDFNQVFKDNRLLINNPADTFAYTIIGAAIAANRNLTLPLLTGNDTIVAEAFAQTLTNKTIDSSSNTISNIINANVSGSAAIVTSKLADSANFILKTLDNSFGAHYQDVTKMTAPGNPGANDVRLYVDTADTHLKIKNNAGTVVDLHATGGSGEVNTLGSVGSGTGTLPATKSGTVLNMKSLLAGTNITLTNNTNDVTIAASGSASNLDGLSDVTITSVAAQNILAYNSGTSQFINTTPIPTTYDYIISKISSTYYATKSGEVIPKYSGTVLTTVLASVATDLSTTGGVVAFAANTTFITNGAAIALQNNITWKGMDRITSIVKSSSNHQIFRWNDAGGLQLTNAGITDLHLIIHDTLTTDSAVYIDGSVNFKFLRNWIESKGSSGSSIPSTGVIATFFDTEGLIHFHDNMEVKDNWWTGYNNGQDAFGNGNLRNCIVTGNFFKDHIDGQGIGAASPIFTIFANNTFHNVGNAIGFETVTEDCIVANNICYNTKGIKMAGDSSSNISRRNLVDGNIIIYGDGGIEAGNCYYDTFVNNKIIRTGIYGIRGALHRCLVRGNEFIDTNHSNASTTVNSISNTRGGIMIINNTANQPDSDSNIIKDNRLVDTGATFTDPVSATSKSGNTGPIVLDTNCDSNILIDNQYIGLVGGTVVDYGTNTVTRGLVPDMFENSKWSELYSELFIGDPAYGSGLFATTFEAAQGTTGYDFAATLPSRSYTTGAVSGNKGGKVSDADIKRNMLPKLFCKFAMNATSNHALFIGLATGFAYDAVHATTPLNAMMGIGVAAITGVTNFRVIHNDASGTCTSLDTGKALDTSFHTIEIWSDDTNWYYDFDRGFKKGTITTDMPDSTTRMYLQWTNLTNTAATQKFNVSKMTSKVKG